MQKALDRETVARHELEVRASDGAQASNAAVTVTVTDVNDQAPEFTQPWYSLNVAEDARTGAWAGCAGCGRGRGRRVWWGVGGVWLWTRLGRGWGVGGMLGVGGQVAGCGREGPGKMDRWAQLAQGVVGQCGRDHASCTDLRVVGVCVSFEVGRCYI